SCPRTPLGAAASPACGLRRRVTADRWRVGLTRGPRGAQFVRLAAPGNGAGCGVTKRGLAAMKVGVPKEVKNHEYRVAITPAGVHELTRSGHEVFLEQDAGTGSAIPDAD